MNAAVAVLTALIIGFLAAGAGFYFGYDKGYEQAVLIAQTPTPDILTGPTITPLNDVFGVQSLTPTTIPETEIDPRITTANTQLIGVWQSTDDTKFQREYRINGTVVDTYTGSTAANTSGTWILFTSNDNETTPFQQNNVDVYIKETAGGQPTYFRIAKVAPDELELIHMERGNTLRFTKVK